MSFPLHNIYSREQLQAKRAAEDFERKALSFYRYIHIPDPTAARNDLYRSWYPLDVLGRVYISHEGINAQLSVPKPSFDAFAKTLEDSFVTEGIYLNEALTEGKDAFLKLDIKVRNKIVADGLKEDIFANNPGGQHLDPLSFHEKLQDPNTIVVDTRNDYECEIGHFEGAILPESETFRDVLPELKEKLAPHKDKEILMYCTGGIRCEKASAYFKKQGYDRVYQLQGGILNYIRTMRDHEMPSKFHGSNFVFDGRMAEPVDEDVSSTCITCGTPTFKHMDCANQACHRLIVQCDACATRLQGCCSETCAQILCA